MLLLLAVKVLHVEDAINDVMPIAGLRFSQWFLGDYLVAILASALIFALGTAELPIGQMRPVVWLAGLSFSLYLTHFPLLQFFAAAMPGQHMTAMMLALACALSFGMVFEPQKDRLRRLLNAALAAGAAYRLRHETGSERQTTGAGLGGRGPLADGIEGQPGEVIGLD